MKLKRSFDIFMSIVSLSLFAPIFLFVSIISLIVQGRPVFFFQKRVGLNNKEFSLIKFRTMSNNEHLSEKDRVGRWGMFLRKTSLDELPELINILIGQMSFVGPRPLLVEYLNYYNDEEIKRHNVLPGLTGLAQISGRNTISWEKKFKYDLDYINEKSFLLDLKIILKTAFLVLKRRGVNSNESLSMERFDNPFYVLGAGGHGKAVISVCEEMNLPIRGILDDFSKDELLGHKILGKVDSKNTGRAIIAIGSGKVRKRISESVNLSWKTIISPSAVVHPTATIGEGSIVMANCYVGPSVVIGKHTIINNGATIEHDTKIGDFTHIAPNAVLCGSVDVGNFCFVGAGSCVKNNIFIDSDITIGAGSCVVKNINDQSSIYAGVPAKRISMASKVQVTPIKMASPVIEEDDISAVVEVLKSGHLSLGPKIIEFEEAFKSYTGSKHAVAVSSGTAGLHISLLSMGIGPGDEVIVPSFTFVSSVSTIVHTGATPVFVDIEPETYCVDPEAIKELISDKTKAIMIVDVFGHPANWTEINKIAKDFGLFTIDDSCEALGATWGGKKVGSFADTSVFAFYPNKQITTGEGGIVVTDDDELATKMRMYRNHGRSSMGKWLKHDFIGYNYRMNEMNAALGVSQMKKLDKILDGRRVIAEKYNKYFKSNKYIRPQIINSNAHMSWFVYVVTLSDGICRDKIIDKLQEASIPSRAYFEPIHDQPMMQKVDHRSGKLTVTENIAKRTIALPFCATMTDTEIEFVAVKLSRLVEQEMKSKDLPSVSI